MNKSLKHKALGLCFVLTLMFDFSARASDNSGSTGQNGSNNVVAMVVTFAIFPLAATFSGKIIDNAYCWITGTETPTERAAREKKEADKRHDEFLKTQSSIALEVEEKAREKFFRLGVLTREQNEEIKRAHAKRLLSIAQRYNKETTLDSLLAQGKKPSDKTSFKSMAAKAA